jgi:adenylosuccinate lyase
LLYEERNTLVSQMGALKYNIDEMEKNVDGRWEVILSQKKKLVLHSHQKVKNNS